MTCRFRSILLFLVFLSFAPQTLAIASSNPINDLEHFEQEIFEYYFNYDSISKIQVGSNFVTIYSSRDSLKMVGEAIKKKVVNQYSCPRFIQATDFEHRRMHRNQAERKIGHHHLLYFCVRQIPKSYLEHLLINLDEYCLINIDQDLQQNFLNSYQDFLDEKRIDSKPSQFRPLYGFFGLI